MQQWTSGRIEPGSAAYMECRFKALLYFCLETPSILTQSRVCLHFFSVFGGLDAAAAERCRFSGTKVHLTRPTGVIKVRSHLQLGR